MTTAMPKKQQIIEDLTAEIRSGRLAPGKPIPSARELKAAYDVSDTPVRQAVDHLKSVGLVVWVPGIGMHVANPLPPERPITDPPNA